MTKLTVKDLLDTAETLGCTVTAQKSFNKIVGPYDNRKAIYVGHAKRVVTRIDFAGFELGDHEVLQHISEEKAKELNLGAVRAQILTKNLPDTVTDEAIMEAFGAGLDELLSETEGFKLGVKSPTEDEVTEGVEETPADVQAETDAQVEQQEIDDEVNEFLEMMAADDVAVANEA